MFSDIVNIRSVCDKLNTFRHGNNNDDDDDDDDKLLMNARR